MDTAAEVYDQLIRAAARRSTGAPTPLVSGRGRQPPLWRQFPRCRATLRLGTPHVATGLQEAPATASAAWRTSRPAPTAERSQKPPVGRRHPASRQSRTPGRPRLQSSDATPTCPLPKSSQAWDRTATAWNACRASEPCATSSTAWATDSSAFRRPSRSRRPRDRRHLRQRGPGPPASTPTTRRRWRSPSIPRPRSTRGTTGGGKMSDRLPRPDSQGVGP